MLGINLIHLFSLIYKEEIVSLQEKDHDFVRMFDKLSQESDLQPEKRGTEFIRTDNSHIKMPVVGGNAISHF